MARKQKQVLDSKISWSTSELLPRWIYGIRRTVERGDAGRNGRPYVLANVRFSFCFTDRSVMFHGTYGARSFRELPDTRTALISAPMSSLLTIYANGYVICVRPREAQSDIRVDTSSEVSGTGVSMSTPHPPAIAKAPACT
jgi:hypothetical protein